MIWKNGAKTAFNIGFDLDGETIWRNKAGRQLNGETYIMGPSIGRFGPVKGAFRILEILKEYDIKATWFVPAETIETFPDTIEAILKEGHELSHHGYDHRGNYGTTFEEQAAYLEKCQAVFEKYAGVKALGFRGTGPVLPETEKWMFTEGGFIYNSCGVSGEYCGWYSVNGERTNAINLPCRDEQMDDYVQTVFHSWPGVLEGMPRIAPYRNPYDNWVCEVEGMLRYGNSGSSAFHPQIAGTPGRAVMFERFCRYLADNKNIWCTTCEEIARYYIAENGGEGHAE